jgi:hypothetical protein
VKTGKADIAYMKNSPHVPRVPLRRPFHLYFFSLLMFLAQRLNFIRALSEREEHKQRGGRRKESQTLIGARIAELVRH